MVGIGVIASALGIAAGLLIDWFPVAASEEAKPIDTLWDVLIIFSVPVFVGVTVVVLFSVMKFRMRPGEENLDGPPIHGNTRLEVIWTAIPAIILVGLCTYAFVVLEDVEAADANPVQVRVVGEQFAWTFFYKQRRQRGRVAAQLHVPIDRQVKFTIQSKDVLHDFWVPGLPHEEGRGAGDRRDLHRHARTGSASYPIVCAELCGLGHAVMRSTATVDTQEKYDAWLAALGKPAESAGGGDGGGGGGAAPARTARRSSRPRSQLRRLPHAGRRGRRRHDRPGPRHRPQGQGRGVHQAVDRRSERRDRRPATRTGSCRRTSADTLAAAQVDALVKYLSEVTKGG